MKKIGALLFIFILTLSIGLAQNSDKLDKANECLTEKVGDCSALTVEEMALTILSSSDSTMRSNCERELGLQKSAAADCWPKNNCKIKSTALAILALNNLGENTKNAESWLLSKNKTPEELIWYIQQDSDKAAKCKISYDSNSYDLTATENKKLEAPAGLGNCLSLAQSNFWLEISQDCYEKEFLVECDQKFMATLLYKNKDYSTIFVLPETEYAAATKGITLKVNSKCFATDSCEYEPNAWATYALSETGNDVTSYIPYLIALDDSNKIYLPNAFIYMVTGYSDYAERLLKEQDPVGGYWDVSNNNVYDTALALLALGPGSSDKATEAENKLLFNQPAEGCWNNYDITDTAIVLWALTGRTSPPPSGTTSCTPDFFCISTADCPEAEQLNNYHCSGSGKICCKTENLKSCDELGGEICSSNENCDGISEKSINDSCCIGECKPKPQKTQCEEFNYNCRTSCSDTEEETDYDCDEQKICCKTKTTSSGGSSLIWILIILILIIGAVIAYLKRDNLKLFFFKLKNNFKKESGAPPAPPHPPRPGFPPIRRMPQRPAPQQSPPQQSPQRHDAMDNVFKKLKDMTR